MSYFYILKLGLTGRRGLKLDQVQEKTGEGKTRCNPATRLTRIKTFDFLFTKTMLF
jgi:hypothetical protein